MANLYPDGPCRRARQLLDADLDGLRWRARQVLDADLDSLHWRARQVLDADLDCLRGVHYLLCTHDRDPCCLRRPSLIAHEWGSRSLTEVEQHAGHEDRITATKLTQLGGLSFGQWVHSQ